MSYFLRGICLRYCYSYLAHVGSSIDYSSCTYLDFCGNLWYPYPGFKFSFEDKAKVGRDIMCIKTEWEF